MVLDNDFQVGEWVVKPHTNMIEGPKGETHLEPKAMQVLALLAQRCGDVVQKQEILEDVWEGTYVSDEVLPNAIWELRKALGDDARRPTFIQTVPKKGYRLIAHVTHVLPETADNALEATASRHSRRWWIAGALATALLVGLVWVRTDSGTATRRVGTASEPYSVLVMSFQNHTNVDDLGWLSSGAPTMLRTGLAEIVGIQVVSTQRLESVLDELGDDGGHKNIARSTGAEAVVLGSIFKLGDEYRIDVQIEDVAGEEIIAAHSARGVDVFGLMDDLTAWVRDSLGTETQTGSPVRPLADMTTTSLEAFRLYNAGVTARRNLRLRDAQELLTQAIDTDPSFALAYLELQTVALFSKNEAGYEAAHDKVVEHREHLPPHRQRLLEASELWDEGPVEAERMLFEVIAQFPEEEEAYMQLSHLYSRSYRTDDARNVLKRGADALPHSGYLRLYYGYQLLKEGRFPEAIHEFEIYSRIRPEEANPRDSLGEAYLIAGIPERALEEYAHALKIDANFGSAHLGRAWAFSQTGRFGEALDELDAIGDDLPPGYSSEELRLVKSYFLSRAGRYESAELILREIETKARDLDDPTMLGVTHLYEALLELENGHPVAARSVAEQASAALPVDGRRSRSLRGLTELLLGIAASRNGELNQAHEHLSALQASYEPRSMRENWWYHLLLGEIALASGDARAAYAAFTQGTPDVKMVFNITHSLENLTGALSFRDGAARAKALEGEREEAIALYEKLIRPDIGQKWTAPLEPRYHMRLARLHRDLGEREEASRHYRRVLSLWSQADPLLPELAEAEAYLTTS
jgi:DNA-binding winged helix-turn-helix (wHTH) protein/tetratricopeptide (TPR) repeat protein/TolB-like protein